MSSEKDQTIPKLKIRQIEIRTHVHATESLETVSQMLLDLVSDEISKKSLRIDYLSGTYGQKIIDIRLFLKKQTNIKNFIRKLGQYLSSKDKFILRQEFPQRLDRKNKFYFRIEKQQAAMGQIRLADSNDVIQLILSNYNRTPMIKLQPKHFISYYSSINLI